MEMNDTKQFSTPLKNKVIRDLKVYNQKYRYGVPQQVVINDLLEEILAIKFKELEADGK